MRLLAAAGRSRERVNRSNKPGVSHCSVGVREARMGGGKRGINRDRMFERIRAFLQAFFCSKIPVIAPLEISAIRICILCERLRTARAFFRAGADVHRMQYVLRDSV